jgi:hypothetical protein
MLTFHISRINFAGSKYIQCESKLQADKPGYLTRGPQRSFPNSFIVMVLNGALLNMWLMCKTHKETHKDSVITSSYRCTEKKKMNKSSYRTLVGCIQSGLEGMS